MSRQRALAWRRAQRAKHVRHAPQDPFEKREKSWKLLYLRSVKNHRARQLGMLWPHREWMKVLADAEPVNVLFVCSRNQWRSPTAEKVWSRTPGVQVRSAGTSRSARRPLRVADLRWADLILVMEEKHRTRIRAEFRDEVRFKELHVLDIPDAYQFMDPDLVALVSERVAPLILGRAD